MLDTFNVHWAGKYICHLFCHIQSQQMEVKCKMFFVISVESTKIDILIIVENEINISIECTLPLGLYLQPCVGLERS